MRMSESLPRDVTGGNIQDKVAYRIRAELVCCDLYGIIQREAARLEAEGHPDGHQSAIGRAVIRGDWHDLCYWGEASARIAEGRCAGYETIPNVCRCPCEGCKHNCSGHQGGEGDDYWIKEWDGSVSGTP